MLKYEIIADVKYWYDVLYGVWYDINKIHLKSDIKRYFIFPHIQERVHIASC